MPRNTRVPAGQMTVTTSLPMSQADAAPASAASAPPLGLVGALSSVTVPRSFPDESVFLALGVNLVAGDRPLEIHVKRKSYQDPIVADQLIGRGARKRTKRLPDELLDGAVIQPRGLVRHDREAGRTMLLEDAIQSLF